MKFKTANTSRSAGDNIIDRTVSGEGGFSNEPAFPNQGGSNPADQGGSGAWAGMPEVAPPSGSTEQYYDIGDDLGLDDPSASLTLPEQDYAKPTEAARPNALGPGMSSRG